MRFYLFKWTIWSKSWLVMKISLVVERVYTGHEYLKARVSAIYANYCIMLHEGD